tara:strand:- start:455 stop:733 length:279 start_codon:yes stop_codon:yes gene_type:complete
MSRTAHTKRLGAVKLKHWLSANDMPQMGLAARLSITQAAVSNIITGRSTPSLAMACMIQAFTRGAVTVTDWLDSEAAVRVGAMEASFEVSDG